VLASRSAFSDRRIHHHLQLDLLDFRQPLPLPRQDMVDLFMQVPDFQRSFEVEKSLDAGLLNLFRGYVGTSGLDNFSRLD
jgi:hypothetical protein